MKGSKCAKQGGKLDCSQVCALAVRWVLPFCLFVFLSFCFFVFLFFCFLSFCLFVFLSFCVCVHINLHVGHLISHHVNLHVYHPYLHLLIMVSPIAKVTSVKSSVGTH